MKASVLLVDDEIDFLDLMKEFLEDIGCAVETATNGYDALKLLEKKSYDLLLSDINMPGMKGFQLLDKASIKYPDLKRVLITAYDVRDYIHLAKNYNIGNIINKSTPFNFNEIETLLNNIITGDIFGLGRYISGKIYHTKVTSDMEIEEVNNNIISKLQNARHIKSFKQALCEIVVNAVFYGARNENGNNKHNWKTNVILNENEEILIAWGSDKEKAGISVTDQKGRLLKKDILFWFERNMTRGEDGLIKGLSDNHGKGLFITREFIDRLIVNIEPRKKTEIVMINYNTGLYDGHKPVWIQEL
ncbi:MAG: response regulator [Chitinispirillia bacterium]|jgi:CheY-like chemotaxis protein